MKKKFQVMEFTVTNTSKEMSSFSDYPPSPDFPIYWPHKMMLKYLADYADHFGVTQCIRFEHVVHKVCICTRYENYMHARCALPPTSPVERISPSE